MNDKQEMAVGKNIAGRHQVTSGDVARHANVSQSAVSRAFTPGASISKQTRERILKAASELGYRPNALARAMISGKSRLIAILVAYLDNQFYPIVLEKLTKNLQEKGYRVLLFMSDPGNQDRFVHDMLEFQVQGIVMASATLSSTLALECASAGIPVVLFNRYVPSSPASSVTSDNIEGGRLLAHFLVRAGHSRIAYIAGAEDASTNRDREAGFHRGLAENGVSLWGHAVGGYTFDGAAAAARQLCQGDEIPDAIFVANDHMAFSVMDVLRHELGLEIPRDISIVGYDDVPEASWKAYDLTTISQSSQAMIENTVAILLDQIENREVQKSAAVVPAELIVRSSSRLPK